MKALLLLGLLVIPFARAQEAMPAKHFRSIPLGDLPPHREKIENGVRIHLPHPPGTIPPKPTSLAIDGKKLQDLPLRLKEFTKLNSIKPAAGGVKIFEGNAAGEKPWIASKFPVKNHSLGVLYPDHQKKNWFNPKMMIVPDDASSFPLGTVRFVNVSHCTALVRFGKSKTDVIKPGGVLIKKLKQGGNPALVGYFVPGKAGAREVIFENTFNIRPKQRIQAFLYQAQGKNPRKEMKLFHQPEFFIPPPKPKKAATVAGG